MSSSGSILLPEDPWKVVLHDIKVALNPAILTLEAQLAASPSTLLTSQREEAAKLLKDLYSIVNSSLGSLQSKAEVDTPAKERFIAECRNKLGEALVKADTILKAQTTPPSGEDPLVLIVQAIKNSQGVVDPSLAREPIPLGLLLNGKVQHHRQQLQESKNEINLTFIPPELATAEVKGEQVNLIKSIVGNCIENATKYASGSKIDITIQRSQSNNDCFEIVFKDNGPGMSQDVLEGVRKGLVVTTGGHGVGLSGLYAKVTSLADGASLTVNSNTNPAEHGTQFTWTLPTARVLMPLSAPTAQAAATPAASQKEDKQFIIYFIDDSKINLRVIKATLERALVNVQENKDNPIPCVVRTAANSDPIKQLGVDERKQIIGIMTDIDLNLDDKNGLTEAYSLIKDGLIHPNVIIFTYAGEEEDDVNKMPDFENVAPYIKGHVKKGDKKAADQINKFLTLTLQTAALEAGQSRVEQPATTPQRPTNTSTGQILQIVTDTQQENPSPSQGPQVSPEPTQKRKSPTYSDPSSPVHATRIVHPKEGQQDVRKNPSETNMIKK